MATSRTLLKRRGHMPPRRSPKRAPDSTSQLTIRLDNELLEKLDQLAKKLSPPGVELSRSDALRAAIKRGLLAYEKDESRDQ